MSDPTHEETLEQFIERTGLVMEVEQMDDRPGPDSWPPAALHYRCTIERRPEFSEGKTAARFIVVYFSMGPALVGNPSLERVLDCLAGDIASVENADGKWSWASEVFSMPTNEDEGRQLDYAWEEINRQRRQLEAMLGRDNLDRLLWHTERR